MSETRRYRVVGPTAYRGHPPRAEFIAALSEREEARALERGNVVVLGRELTLAERREMRGAARATPYPPDASATSEEPSEGQYAPLSRIGGKV